MKNIIIPGFGSNKILFKNLIDKIPELIYLDIPQHKYSDTADELNKINDKVNLIGWSLGSLFSLNYAIDNPDKVNSIILMGATARFTSKNGYENGIEQKKLDQMIALIKRRKEAVMHDFYLNILENVKDKEYYLKLLMDNLPELQSLQNGLNELKTIDLLEKIEFIKTKVLIIHGKNDKITPLISAQILKDKLINSELIITEGSHCLFLENSNDIVDAIKQWLYN